MVWRTTTGKGRVELMFQAWEPAPTPCITMSSTEGTMSLTFVGCRAPSEKTIVLLKSLVKIGPSGQLPVVVFQLSRLLHRLFEPLPVHTQMSAYAALAPASRPNTIPSPIATARRRDASRCIL